jgi:uncharacterized protein YhfF
MLNYFVKLTCNQLNIEKGKSDLVEDIEKKFVKSFWQEYLATLPKDEREALKMPEAWAFGDNAELADELGELVVAGIKTATASLPWEYEAEGSQIPKPGDLSIILDGNGSPICLIETVEVEVRPFNKVSEQFAFDEGEGDRTLEFWRDAHWRFFTRICRQVERTFTEEMSVVCERFKLVYLPA